ncbi:MAG: DUF1611 domain-containing protein [bacterium]|nr:MAG: DUF1611 domain-containing protein [bacterium]
MTDAIDGNAIVYCEGAFNTPNGKTAHGLIRFTRRYRVLAVVDSRFDGRDAGEVLDGRRNGITIYTGIDEAAKGLSKTGTPAAYLVVGLAPDGGRFGFAALEDMKHALEIGLNIDSGLHDFLTDDPEMTALAEAHGVAIRDVRKPPPRNELHFFSGKIEEVSSFKVAVLGTDSAVGKRTTAWLILQALEERGERVELVGTGQTAWLQGAQYSIMLDSLINDFVSGEIEHAVWSAWHERKPSVIVIEGQGSLMNPAYPGGFEILAAGRPDVVVLQHAPARRDYDGFPGYRIQPLEHQIRAIEVISGKPVVAIAVNHENIDTGDIDAVCGSITKEIGLPAFDVLVHGAEALTDHLVSTMQKHRRDGG